MYEDLVASVALVTGANQGLGLRSNCSLPGLGPRKGISRADCYGWSLAAGFAPICIL